MPAPPTVHDAVTKPPTALILPGANTRAMVAHVSSTDLVEAEAASWTAGNGTNSSYARLIANAASRKKKRHTSTLNPLDRLRWWLLARLFPGVIFVIGADTAVRLVALRYYQESEARMVEALSLLRKQGCRFLVAGRTDPAGSYLGLEQIAMPGDFQDLFTAIPKTDFHIRISSSEIRALTQPVANSSAGD